MEKIIGVRLRFKRHRRHRSEDYFALSFERLHAVDNLGDIARCVVGIGLVLDHACLDALQVSTLGGSIPGISSGVKYQMLLFDFHHHLPFCIVVVISKRFAPIGPTIIMKQM